MQTGGGQVGHVAGGVGAVGEGANVVDVEDVDMGEVEAIQAGLNRAQDAVAGVVIGDKGRVCADETVVGLGAFGDGGQQAAGFGGDDDFGAGFGGEKAAEALFGQAGAVEGCGVEIADAAVPCGLQGGLGGVGGAGLVEAGDPGAAKAEFGQVQAG